ncbi:MAG: metal-dependent phosphohydrolase [Oscillatoria sp. PMC 1051.18]|uniref:Npun_R2479 family HD domain-containing metalloprotein n=1 Tax=Oscillatoria salina TaxID=331517 RepID=UPI0013B6F0B7|nr:Npun_R2479 family HD domain-containing metalloprotein [Oscillatoria salina]MBZ8182972.1 metal-dependent phosphohydrolase [Oscillatoria salina IIICB1]MEC4892244.1 metal-dependent phosphohydrolase [Oscillatoria sp. PMC 1050.18]MEC5028777.1 metal-dependent phosphohydrolase [Oscillatoria sp. PMC 1051.18]NET86522.1 metal-dependent phosphohydrolase [Kamptonema sp. SIO1D9]
MFNPTNLLIDTLIAQLTEGYHRTYGGWKSEYAEIISWGAAMALENIANSDALYHNVEHTVFVTLVGQEILRGKHIKVGGVSCEDWLHFHLSLLCHDIGYVRGVCRPDRPQENLYATGVGDVMISVPPGSTDASMAPYHVDRGKLFVQERFGGHTLIDAEILKANIELTRFPVPADDDHKNTENYPGLVRAADLIGQLSDPRYLQKIPALFYEFEEIGANKNLGYESPGELRRNYPSFYWKVVYPYVKTALSYLELTQAGKQVMASLYANVFRVEHEEQEALVFVA